MAPTLQIRLFSELSLCYDDRPIGLKTARSQALLALLTYLLLHRYAPQSRQRIAFPRWTAQTRHLEGIPPIWNKPTLRGCFKSPFWCIKTTKIPLNPPFQGGFSSLFPPFYRRSLPEG
jgi:hypothetical protein